ncbi:MAG: hypothetical protein ACJASC_000642 [Limimaricola cinnabarinus]|jgi:hypothetical protein
MTGETRQMRDGSMQGHVTGTSGLTIFFDKVHE